MLLVEGDQTLGEGQSDSVDLGGVTTSSDLNLHVIVSKLLVTEKKDGFEDLGSHDGGLHEIDGHAVHFYSPLTNAHESGGNGVLLSSEGVDQSGVSFSHLICGDFINGP